MAQALASDPRGLKRICMSCGTRFYDLNKRPIACPNCDTEYTGEFKVKTRRGRLSALETDGQVTEAAAAETSEEAVEEEEVAEEETVSLEEVVIEEEADDAEDDALDIDDDVDDLDDDLDDDDDDDDLDVEVEDDEK